MTFPNRLTRICNFKEDDFEYFLGTKDPEVFSVYPQYHHGFSCRVVKVVNDTTGLLSVMQDNTLSCLFLAEYVITNCNKKMAKQVCDKVYKRMMQDKCYKNYALTELRSLAQIEYAIRCRCKKDYLAHIAKNNQLSAHRAIQRQKFRQLANRRELAVKEK